MIIVRSPLRISLGGGGTDLPSYYENNEGFVIAAAIDKYIYVNINRPFVQGIFLKYSQFESVSNVKEIKHNIIREALLMENLTLPQIEITSLADIPAGTGLGSSGSFTTALIKALYSNNKKYLSQNELAELACFIEIDRLKEPIGKQDQFIAAYGGITTFTFNNFRKVEVKKLELSEQTIYDLEDNLLLFFTGYTRKASSILLEQNNLTQVNDIDMIDNLNYVKELGYQIKDALLIGDTSHFGTLMDKHWQHKKKRSGKMSNPRINYLYDKAIANGALGGKLVGAGGGGFLMFMADDRVKLRNAMTTEGLEEVRFKFDFEGTKVVLS